MKIGKFEKTLENIAERIVYLINKYSSDLKGFGNVGLGEFFDLVSNEIEYWNDPPGDELIMRPSYLLKVKKGDCDDKTVLLGAYLKFKNIPFGISLVSSSVLKNYHHVFPFVAHKGKRLDVDATYKNAKIFESRSWAARKDIIILGA